MSDWEDTAEEAGFGTDDPGDEKQYVSLNEGANEVVTYTDHERPECNDHENEKGYCNSDGKTIQYNFISPLTQQVRELRRNSKGVFYAFMNAKVEAGDTIRIIRTGQGREDTRYKIEKMTDDQVELWIKERKEAIEATQTEAPKSEIAGDYKNPQEVIKKMKELRNQ